jgi:hypothetical protein
MKIEVEKTTGGVGVPQVDASNQLVVNVSELGAVISGEDQLNKLLAIRQKAGTYHVHEPAEGTKATIAKAASATYKHVCTGFTVSAFREGSPTANFCVVQLKDGSTVLWSALIPLGVDLTGGNIVVNNCWFEGTVNTAMTLAFAADNANITMVVSMSIVDVI